MYNNINQSDVVIKFGGRTIHAHKIILMARSGLFYTAFNSKFAVAQASTYEIEGHEPDIIEHMIRFIYDLTIDMADKTSKSPQDFPLEHFMIANEYDVAGLGRAATAYLVGLCDHYVKCSTTDANHLTSLRLVLGQISALYQDNVIADRSLINGIAKLLRTEPCCKLIISIPEVLEIFYTQRTTDLGYRPSPTATSTLFPPVTMADYARPDPEGFLNGSVFSRKPKEPRVPSPSRPFRNNTSKRR